jgi:hypothetical protein
MPKFILFALLGSFLLGFILIATSFGEHLRGGGLPLLSSLREQRTPRGRVLFKRFVAGVIVASLSIAMLLSLGPWKF